MTTQTSKTNTPNHLKDLLLLFAVPAGIALFAAVVVYLPRVFANPKSDFIYSYCQDYGCSGTYFVDAAGYVSKNQLGQADAAALRYYDASADATKSLTLEEARKFKLNSSSKSPDGYTLSREENGGGFLFWGEYDQGWYLKNGARKKRVELNTSNSYYADQIDFLGWVKP